MKFLHSIRSLLALACSVVQAQNASVASWTDAGTGVSFSLAIPNVTAAPFPILLSITAPAKVAWVGFATGACMLRSPLVVAWPNGTSAGVTTRWATQYHPPQPYPNTTLTTYYTTSTVNTTHWKANLLCSEGCSSWYGGSIDPNNSNATFGYAASSHTVVAPSSPNSPIAYHDLAKGHFDIDITKAKNSAAAFSALTASGLSV